MSRHEYETIGVLSVERIIGNPQEYSSTIEIGKDGYGVDVKFYSDTAGDYMLWDASEKTLTGVDIIQAWGNGDALEMGLLADASTAAIAMQFTGSAFQIVPGSAIEALNIGADSYVANTTLKGTFTVGEDDTGHDVIFYGAEGGKRIWWDESAGIHYFGASLTQGVEVLFRATTSGAQMLWDISADELIFDKADIQMGDTDFIKFGDTPNGDVTFNFDGSDFVTAASVSEAWTITNLAITTTENFVVGATAAGAGDDATFWASDSAAYVRADASLNELDLDGVDLHINDDDEIRIGDLAAGDWVIKFDGADLTMLPASAIEAMTIGGTSNLANLTLYGALTTGATTVDVGEDVTFWASDAGAYVRIDESLNEFDLDGVDLHINDDDEIRIGDLAAGDWVVAFDGADLNILPASATEAITLGDSTHLANVTQSGSLTLGSNGTGYDVQFFNDLSGSHMIWDTSASRLILNTSTIEFEGDCHGVGPFQFVNDATCYQTGTNFASSSATGAVKVTVGATTGYIRIYAAFTAA